MTTLRQAFKARLDDDAALAALLPGGIFDSDTLGRQGLTPTNAPRLADGVTLAPCAVIRWSTSSQRDLRNARRRYVFVWFYDDVGGATIEAAKLRVYDRLHRHELGPTDDGLGLNFVNWAGDVDDLVAEELQDAAAAYSRFTVDLTRR